MAPNDDRPYVLCLKADVVTTFPDNEYGQCTRCDCDVQHRPHVPTPNHLICLDCFNEVIHAADDGTDVLEFRITPQTLREIDEYKRLYGKRK